jgi:hypothetical protein
LGLKGVFLNVAVGPDPAHQRVLAEDSPASLDQRHENIKGTPADPDRSAVEQKLAAMRQNPEAAELDDRRRLGHRIDPYCCGGRSS